MVIPAGNVQAVPAAGSGVGARTPVFELQKNADAVWYAPT
jgi:hypothetical protein